jgi:hypothetical protein
VLWLSQTSTNTSTIVSTSRPCTQVYGVHAESSHCRVTSMCIYAEYSGYLSICISLSVRILFLGVGYAASYPIPSGCLGFLNCRVKQATCLPPTACINMAWRCTFSSCRCYCYTTLAFLSTAVNISAKLCQCISSRLTESIHEC